MVLDPIMALDITEVSVFNHHGTHTRCLCKLPMFAVAQMWTSMRRDSISAGVLPGLAVGSGAHIGLGWPMKPGVVPCLCKKRWRTAWRHKKWSRGQMPISPSCSSGMQNCKEGVWGPLAAHSQATKYWHQPTVTMLTLIHGFPDLTLVLYCTLQLQPLAPLN